MSRVGNRNRANGTESILRSVTCYFMDEMKYKIFS